MLRVNYLIFLLFYKLNFFKKNYEIQDTLLDLWIHYWTFEYIAKECIREDRTSGYIGDWGCIQKEIYVFVRGGMYDVSERE